MTRVEKRKLLGFVIAGAVLLGALLVFLSLLQLGILEPETDTAIGEFFENIRIGLGGERVLLQPISSCTSLSQNGESYELTGDITGVSGNCFNVFNSNQDNNPFDELNHPNGTTLDGQGNGIVGTGTGVGVDTADNDIPPFGAGANDFAYAMTIQNINISGFGVSVASYPGIYAEPLSAANLRIVNSVLESIDAHSSDTCGGFGCQAVPGAAEVFNGSMQGIVDLIDTNVTDFIEGYSGGHLSGATVNFVSNFITIDGVSFDLSGDGDSDLEGAAGILTLNYSDGFSDSGTIYGTGAETINLRIANRSAGEIFWFEEDDTQAITGSGLSDLDSNVVVSDNFAFISGSLSEFVNREARVTLYDVPSDIQNPAILRDGVPCSPIDCPLFTGLSGDVSFLVPGDGTYTVGSAPLLTLERLSPLGDVIEIVQNQTQVIEINASCELANCNNVNVSLEYNVSEGEPFATKNFNFDDPDSLEGNITSWTDEGNLNASLESSDTFSAPNSIDVISVNTGSPPPSPEVILTQLVPETVAPVLRFYAKDQVSGSDTILIQVLDGSWQTVYTFDSSTADLSSWTMVSVDLFDQGISSVEGIRIRGANPDFSGGPVLLDDICLAYVGGGCIPDLNYDFISDNTGDLNFYIGGQNPVEIASLNVGESQVIPFTVNATGLIGTNEEVLAASFLEFGISRFETPSWNLSIVDEFVDSIPPNVTDLVPIAGSSFDSGQNIEIGANVTDDVAVDDVFVNVTYPDLSVVQVTLSNQGNDWYNSSFVVPNMLGTYNLLFVANDTSNNINDTEISFFVVNDNIPPNVTSLIPLAAQEFDINDEIEIGADVVDNVAVSIVFADLVYPNGATSSLSLINSLGDIYNSSFTIPGITGRYNVTIFANDTSNNINNSEETYFIANDPTQISSCGVVLDMSDTTYTIVQDLVHSGDGACINVQADNVLILGNNRQITGTDNVGGFGINTTGVLVNTSVGSLNLIDLGVGIVLTDSSGGILSGISVSSSNTGILLNGGSDSNLISSVIVLDSESVGLDIEENADANIFDNVDIRNSVSRDLEVSGSVVDLSLTDSYVGSYLLQGLGSVITFRDSADGQISFLESVTGSGTNLSDDVRIENNLATVESDVNPGLNISANVSLFNVPGFVDPRILRNGINCPDGVCSNFTALDQTNVDFNVSYWTNYSIGGNTPDTTIESCGFIIDLPGLTYTIENNLIVPDNSVCIIVRADNVILEGQDNLVSGSNVGTTGILIDGVSNVLIRNTSFNGLLNAIVSSEGNDIQLNDNVIDSVDFAFTFNGTSQRNYVNDSSIVGSRQASFLFKDSVSDSAITNLDVSQGALGSYGVNISSENVEDIGFIDTYLEDYVFADNGNLVYFEDSSNGLIRFLQGVSGSGANLSNDIRIENNLVSVESDSNPGLNRSANVSLFNVPSFEDPVVLRDGEECGSSCYNFTALDASDVVFNVSYWTNYSVGGSAVEPPEPPPEPPPTGGGGGGSSDNDGDEEAEFVVDRSILIVEVIQGDGTVEIINVINTGDVDLDFNVTQAFLGQYLDIVPGNFSLEGRRQVLNRDLRTVNLIFSTEEDDRPGVYTGVVYVDTHGEDLRETVNVVLEILEAEPLFDISSELAKDVIGRNERLEPTISLVNIGGERTVNVTLEYFVKDFADNEVSIGSEVMEVSGDVTFDRSLILPRDIKLGDNVFYAKLIYRDSVATSANVFKVRFVYWWLYLIIALIVKTIIAIILLYFDDDLRRFEWIISSGRKLLAKHEFGGAVGKYKLLKIKYFFLNKYERKVAKEHVLRFYSDLKGHIGKRHHFSPKYNGFLDRAKNARGFSRFKVNLSNLVKRK